MAQRIQLRRGTAAEWTAANPVLAVGEPGVETDTGKQKFGNGVDAWTALPYASKGDQGIPGVADDASVKDLITTPGSQTAGALNATYGPSAIGTPGSPQRTAIDSAVSARVLDRASDVGLAFGLNSVPSYVPSPGKFDVRRSTYNVNARTMAPWLAALARTLKGGTNAHQVNHGDSITRGAGTSSPYPVTSWTARYRDALQNFWAADDGWNAFNDEASTAADPNTVVTGFTRSGSKGLYQEARVSAANGNTIVISGKTVRKFRILYEIVAGGGSFTYQATGEGSATTVDTSVGTPGIGSVTTTANTQPLLRTLTITALGAGVTILAILPIVSDTGRVVLTRGARNGATIGNLVDDPAGSTVSALDVLTYIPADLLVLMMETNNYNQQTPLATYKTQMQTAITQQKNAGGAVLLVATIPPGISPTIPLIEYTKVLYQLADENDIGILDMQHRWTSYAVSNAAPFNYYASDGTTFHPTDAGAADIAAAVQGAVMPGGWGNRKPIALDSAQAWTAMQKFGYPGSSNEQLAVGGSDLFTDGATNAPSVAYALANNVGALWLAPKSGQEIFVRGRARMEGTYQFQFAAVTTAQRPTVGLAAGASVFDTTLGKPIWHNGTGWVDAAGATV